MCPVSFLFRSRGRETKQKAHLSDVNQLPGFDPKVAAANLGRADADRRAAAAELDRLVRGIPLLNQLQNPLATFPPGLLKPLIPQAGGGAPPVPPKGPTIPLGFAPTASPRNFLPDATAQAGNIGKPFQPSSNVLVDLVGGALLEATVGTALALSNTHGVPPPPNLVDKITIAKSLGKGGAKNFLPNAAEAARTPAAQRILIYVIAGQIAGRILGAEGANANEATALQNAEAASSLALTEAAGQTAPLTPQEIDAIRAAFPTAAEASNFIATFNATAAQNAVGNAAQNAAALALIAGGVGLTYLLGQVNPLTGFITLFPRDRTDP